ncbi:type II toxin-antitoxin system VapC family toxin [Enterococcus sp. AZ109]|uniref:type II toxin-antitoxin system VapC family toxin n=1 Tax=Enterococcus sp. AZ109 TaxID=2774634 RepID=UPI003F28AB24
MKYIIDVNIVLDFLTKREGFYLQAKKVYLLSVYGVIEGYLTTNMITDIYYILQKYGKGDPKAEIKKLLQLSRVLPVTSSDCVNALEMAGEDFEDNLIVAVGKKHQVKGIITRNGADFQDKNLVVYTPEEILDKYAEGK